MAVPRLAVYMGSVPSDDQRKTPAKRRSCWLLEVTPSGTEVTRGRLWAVHLSVPDGEFLGPSLCCLTCKIIKQRATVFLQNQYRAPSSGVIVRLNERML